jgi:hypothetical protein
LLSVEPAKVMVAATVLTGKARGTPGVVGGTASGGGAVRR